MASTYLTKTFGSAGSLTTWTLSFWVKKAGNGIEQRIFNCDDDASGNNDQWMKFDGSDILQFSQYQSGYTQKIETNRKFRDNNGWYHIVLVWDTTNGTAGDRTRIYINGVRETSFSSEVQASSSLSSLINNTTYPFEIGRRGLNGSQFFTGSLSHVHFCDGTALAPTVFGSTDATTGEWKINTSPSFTLGTNGFTILKDGNTITDQSSNSNNFTLGAGTLTKTEDCPDNVFATINSLFVNDNGAANALTQGNNTYTSGTSHEWNNMTSTLGASTGKWYWEVKYTQIINTASLYMCDEGVAADLAPANYNLGEGSRSGYGYGWLCGQLNSGSPTSTTKKLTTINGTSTITQDDHNSSITTNDIVGVAWDATNGKLWFHKNGTYIDDTSGNVGNPTTAAYPYISGMQTGLLYTVYADVWNNNSGSSLIKSYNFGNGYFGTTAVATNSGNGYAGAEGSSIFNYQPPTGYTALSTKGLNL